MIVRHRLTTEYLNPSNFYLNFQTEVKVGELEIDKINQSIYTKSLTSQRVRTGNSLQNLTEFSIYEPGVKSSPNIPAFVQFKVIGTGLKLTTVIPSIGIANLGGTNFNDSSFTGNSWLGFDSTNRLRDMGQPLFMVTGLGDVADNLNSAQYNGRVLASESWGGSNPKDPFTEYYYYRWTLKPETTRLLTFDDTLENVKEPYQVVRNVRPDENRSPIAENVPLSITYDTEPKIANNLDCQGRSIVNAFYRTNVINASTSTSNVTCNCNEFNVFVIQCTDINILNLTFSFVPRSASTEVKAVAVIVNNFQGAVQFTQAVQFENGIPLNLRGKNHILNVLLYNGLIRILQKATGLSKVPA